LHCTGRTRVADPAFDDDAFHRAVESLSDEAIWSHRHAFGGWPSLIQNPMELECEMVSNGVYAGNAEAYKDKRMPAFREQSSNWRLLLQLDCDDGLEWMWGDGGMVYFWCREDDIGERRFDRGRTILQCF
jgi:uncharacterized protein YwqG